MSDTTPLLSEFQQWRRQMVPLLTAVLVGVFLGFQFFYEPPRCFPAPKGDAAHTNPKP